MNYLVFKGIVHGMDLQESLIVNGDIAKNIKIISSELDVPKDSEFGIHSFKINYKKVDKEIAEQIAKDKILEDLEVSKPDLVRKIRDGEKKINSKLKLAKLEQVYLDLFQQSPILTKKFEFYVGEDFLLIPKFSGSTIIAEEYLIPFEMKDPNEVLEEMINNKSLELGLSSGQILDNGVVAVIHSQEKIGQVFAGKMMCEEGGTYFIGNVKMEPFSVAAEITQAVPVVRKIINYIKDRKCTTKN